MRKLFFIPLPVFFVCLVLASCSKKFADEQFTPVVNPVIPDLAFTVPAAVSGYVVDENSEPVVSALVKAGNASVYTDEYGYFSISNVALVKAAGLVSVTSAGYFMAYRSFTVNEGKEAFVRLQLLSKSNSGTVDAVIGGTVAGPAGERIVLPANAVVTMTGGNAYTGNVHIASRWIDPSVTANFQSGTPGDSRAIDTSGYLKFARSFGIIAVELSGDAGQLLQVAPGKEATITIPVPTSLLSAAPAQLPLWSFDEQTGFWSQEGMAVKNGNSYTGKVSHFSFWEGAVGLPAVNFSARVLDASLQPLSNVAVVVTPANQPWNAGYGRFGHTDANGYVYGLIPANSQLTLDIATPCATAAYSYPFSTGIDNIDLGVVSGNMGQGLVTVSGTVVNCSATPVTDGYVQVYDGGFYHRIPVVNGNFSFTGLACTNAAVHYVAVDKATQQQNTPQAVTLTTGVNNLGQLTACGVSTISTLTITVNGSPQVFTGSSYQPTGYFLGGSAGTTQIITLGGSNPNPDLGFQFDGGAATGSGHTVSEVFYTGFTGGRAIATAPLTVTITEYGNPGGFITGSFSGNMVDFSTGAPYTVDCNFRVRRFD